jgi:hypothetical protein
MIIGQNLFIKPHAIFSIPETDKVRGYGSIAQIENQSNLTDNKHNGLFSKKALSALKNSVNWLLFAAEPKKVFHKSKNIEFQFKVNFITLSVPFEGTKLSEPEFKKRLLNPWLTLLRSYYSLNNYVWKLEFNKNGNPHIHITTDTFIHYKAIRRTWNKILKENGLIAGYTDKFFGCTIDEYKELAKIKPDVPPEIIYKRWQSGTACGWSDPNTTDVHSVKSIKNLAAYILKYMTKSDELLAAIKGRIWGCSQALSRACKTRCNITPDVFSEELTQLYHASIESKPLFTSIDSFGRIFEWGERFFFPATHWKNYFSGVLRKTFDETILMIQGTIAASPDTFYI